MAMVDSQMDADVGFEVRILGGAKGNGLVAIKPFEEGDVIFEEDPLVACQFPWNASCGYKACDFCLRSLETAEENVRRLLQRPDFVLPHPECCIVNKSDFVECEYCGKLYCSPQCRDSAWDSHHQVLCLRSRARDGSHPLEQLNDAWKNANYPPETSSIMLFARILAIVNQAQDKNAILHQFSLFQQHTINTESEIAHKLMGKHFAGLQDVLRGMLSNILGTAENQHWLTPDGFRSLVALVGTNGQGVASSPLAEWSKRAGDLQGLPADEKQKLDDFIDHLYEDVENVAGGFLDCEGSALYFLQSKSNHSCEPNVEIAFLHGNARLTLRATRQILPDEELTISYLNDCDLARSRHSRHKYLRENYLFNCDCPRCISQLDDPDVTSEEEDDSDLEEDS